MRQILILLSWNGTGFLPGLCTPICCHSVKTKFCELQAENLMLEAFGTCLPTNRAGELFIQTYLDRKEPT